MGKSPLHQIINKYKIMKADDLVSAARSGDPDAACELAHRLYIGKGVEKSYELARQWYEAGADAGNTECYYELGQMLMSGLGGNEDQERAAEMFRKAADAGNPYAMFEIGAMYAVGRGVKKNYVKASKYLRLSGTEQARAMLEDSVNWWRPAAERGITEGEYQYGVCLINGYGIEPDYVEGQRWLYKAALKDHPKALDALSQIYEFGIGVETDKAKALFWKKKYCDVTGIKPGDVGITRDQLLSLGSQEAE